MCIRDSCSPDHIQRFLKRMKESDSDNPDSSGSSSKHLRSSTEGMFHFREHCLFCGEECQVIWPQKNPNRWREAYLCRTADREGQILCKESVIRHAERKSDNWGNDVSFRAHFALSDLHAADAHNNKDCMSKFFSNHPTAFSQTKCDGAVEELITA